MRHRRHRPRPAFTLLELLVATAMTAIVAVALVTAFKSAFKARDDAEATVASSRSMEVTAEILRLDLESALPPRGILAGPFTATSTGASAGASGQVSSLTFHAASPAGDETGPEVGGGEIRRIELTVESAADGSGDAWLIRRVQPALLPGEAGLSPPEESVICRGVVTFALRYYDGVAWADAWDSAQVGTPQENRLPQAVEVTLELVPPVGAAYGSQAAWAASGRSIRSVRVYPLSCATPLTEAELNALSEGGTPAAPQ